MDLRWLSRLAEKKGIYLKRAAQSPLLAGLAAVLILGLALGGLTEDVLEKESIVSLDNWVLNNTHHIQGPVLTREMIFVSLLGSVYFVWPATVMAVILLLRARRSLEAGFFLAAIAGGEVLSFILKNTIQRARPVPPDGTGLYHAWGWGYPSGHALISVIFYFTLAYLAAKQFGSKRAALLSFAAASCFVFSIAVSRLYLQVHYVSDVMAGFLAGLAWFAVCLAVLEHYRGRP